MSEKLPMIIHKKARSQSQYENQIATQKLKESLYNLQTNRYGQRPYLLQNRLLRKLIGNLFKLKELGLLAKNINVKKKDYILNDYHNKSALNGYSRNYGGLFYNR